MPMTKTFLVFVLGLLFPMLLAAGGESPAVREIDALLTAWHRAAAEADELTYFSAMTEDAVFIGTAAGERWTRPEFETWAMPHFQRDSAWVFVAKERHIELAPDRKLAWFDELLDSKSFWPSRGSGVVVRTAKGWRIAHYVLSFTIPNEVTRDIQPIVLRALSQGKK